MASGRPSPRRVAPALAIAMVALALGAAPAAAGLDHTGTYGVHALTDTEDYPGVTCNFGIGPNTLRSIRIRAPIVYGFNRTGGTDTQTVGWRFLIYRTEPPVHDVYSLAFTSPVVKATATDRYNAQWSGRRYAIPDPDEEHGYRVSVKMIWVWPTGSQVEGKAVHENSHYGYNTGGSTSRCGWTDG